MTKPPPLSPAPPTQPAAVEPWKPLKLAAGGAPRILRRILAVDDEPSVTKGIQLRLHSRFDVVGADSAAAAIRELEMNGPFGVIVSDLRMPGMDGISLLEHVRDKYPETIRILLSGTVDMAAAVRAVNTGGIQRLLLKPTPADELERTLDSAFEDYDRQQRERALAFEDPLLLIGTRRAFDVAARRVYGHAVRHQRVLTVAMVDVDFFKHYNDTYGHVAGDDVLKRVAQAIRETTRVSDELFRYGGEEFVMLLPDTGLEGARRALDRYRDCVYDLSISHSSSELGRLTISLGAAVSLPDDRIEFPKLLERANEALYQSKHLGRNRGTVWTAPDASR